MGRRRRILTDTGWYHLMNRGVDHQPIFYADSDRVDFERQLGVGHERFGVEVHAYCLMTNHFHLLVRCPRDGLSEFIHDAMSRFARHVNDRLGRDGPLFRGRFHSVPVTSDSQLLVTLRYVHLNPTDMRDVANLDRYRWSSHRAYLGHRRPPVWLSTATLMEYFGHDRAAYRRFVTEPESSWEPILADALDGMLRLIADEHGFDRNDQRNVARSFALRLIDELDDADAASLAQSIGLTTASAVRSARYRAHRHRDANPRATELIERLLTLVA